MTSVRERRAAQRALTVEHAAWTSCATLATCSDATARDAKTRAGEMAKERARATVARENVAAWREMRAREAAMRALRDEVNAVEAREARAREIRREAVAREARERERRTRARARRTAAAAVATSAREGGGRANEALLAYFRARDASETARRREAVERVRGELAAAARELRLRAATSRTAPVVARSSARAASATESWLYRRAATLDEHFRVMDGELDVFERANREGWILDDARRRRATPSWREAIPSW